MILLDVLDVRPSEYRLHVVLDEACRRDFVLAMAQTCLHDLDMKGFDVIPTALALTALTGSTTGLAIQGGANEICISPVIQGQIKLEAVQRTFVSIYFPFFSCSLSFDCSNLFAGRVASPAGSETTQPKLMTTRETSSANGTEEDSLTNYVDFTETATSNTPSKKEPHSMTTELCKGDHDDDDESLVNEITEGIKSCLALFDHVDSTVLSGNMVVSGFSYAGRSFTDSLRTAVANKLNTHGSTPHIATGISPLADAYFGAIILKRSQRARRSRMVPSMVPLPEYYDPELWQAGVVEFTRSHQSRVINTHSLNPFDDSRIAPLT